MKFFTGLHHPSDAGKVAAGFISVHALKRRTLMRMPATWPWILDSGAFSTLLMHGCYPEPPHIYAAAIRRWASFGDLQAAVSQDYMCEPEMLERTGFTVADHQYLTVSRYDRIRHAGTDQIYLMPVLQGYAPGDYVEHIRQYGDRLVPGMWTGVGSLCKRNADVAAIEDVLLAVHKARPDLLLHGFGVKTTALQSGLVRDLLYSADSMAWSYHARKHGRDGNSPAEARRFASRIAAMPVQTTLIGDL